MNPRAKKIAWGGLAVVLAGWLSHAVGAETTAVYAVKIVPSAGGAIEYSIMCSGQQMEHAGASKQMSRAVPSDGSCAVLVEAQAGTEAMAEIVRVDGGKQDGRASASGQHLVASVVGEDRRVVAFK